MELQAFKSELKFKLTSGILNLEIDDAGLILIINSALREILRYIDETYIITVPYCKCIDLSEYKVNSVTSVYRTDVNSDFGNASMTFVDPMWATSWQLLSGADAMTNLSNFAYNYGAWNTWLLIRNTVSTDLSIYFDKSKNLLYINSSSDIPKKVTIEFIPIYDSVDLIKTDYWIDICMRMSVALGKILLGNIRTRYVQLNALWTLNGQQLLDEGNAELTALREYLQTNSLLCYPID